MHIFPTELTLFAAALRTRASCCNAEATEFLGNLTVGKLVYETLELALDNRAVICRFANRSEERPTTDGKGAAVPLGTTSSRLCVVDLSLGEARSRLLCT